MSVSGYVRGIPTYKDAEGNEKGMLCETKEKCITDESGIPLNRKLEDMQAQINETAAKTDASTLEGHGASYFATSESVAGIVDGTKKVGNTEKLDGHDSSHFATAESVTNITNGTTKVGNAGKLDGNTADAFAKKTDLAYYLQGVVVPTDPGVGASTSYVNGTLIFVKE